MNGWCPERVDEVDRHRAAAADVGAAGRGGHAHRLDRVLARPHRREEPVGRLVEVVVVADAVERDVEERLGQAVDGRAAARDAGLIDADQIGDGVEHIARRRRDLRDLIDVERRRDRRRLRVDQLGAGAGDRDCLREAADVERRVHDRRDAHLHPHVGDHRGLEAAERHRHGIGAGRQRRHGERPGRVGERFEFRARRGTGDDDGGAGNDAFGGVGDDAGNG